MTRIILLGASNLTNGFPLVVSLLRGGLAGPLDVLAAHGHGRSYGRWSRVFHRALPGISRCGLWDDFAARPAAGPTFALLTDVGNDLMYGAPVSTIVEWVASCLDRLAARDARITLTLLPLASLEQLSAWRYHAAHRILFPKRRPPVWTEMRARALDLAERFGALGERYAAQTVTPAGEWYGLDPIHIRRSLRPQVWRQILSQWPGFNASATLDRLTWRRARALRRCRPLLRRVFSREQTTPQPVWRSGELTLSMY